MLNIYIGQYLPKALTPIQLRSYAMFKVLVIVRNNKSVCLHGILNFPLIRDEFPYSVVKEIHLDQGVL